MKTTFTFWRNKDAKGTLVGAPKVELDSSDRIPAGAVLRFGGFFAMPIPEELRKSLNTALDSGNVALGSQHVPGPKAAKRA